jgi:DNA repair protein RadC
MNSTYTILVRDNSVGSVREATADEIITAARQALARRVRRGTELSSPKLTSDYLRMRLSTREHEIFVALYLDNRHRVIEYTELFRGTIDGAPVYPREVVKEALRHNASASGGAGAHRHSSPGPLGRCRRRGRLIRRKGAPMSPCGLLIGGETPKIFACAGLYVYKIAFLYTY